MIRDREGALTLQTFFHTYRVSPGGESLSRGWEIGEAGECSFRCYWAVREGVICRPFLSLALFPKTCTEDDRGHAVNS